MANTEVLKIVIDKNSMRKARQVMDETLGPSFYRKSFQTAKQEFEKYLTDTHQLSLNHANSIASQYTEAFRKASVNFGDQVKNAVETGSATFQDSMKDSIQKISEIQADADQAHKDAVKDVIDTELEAMRTKVLADRKRTEELKQQEEIAKKAAKKKAEGIQGDNILDMYKDRTKTAPQKVTSFISGKLGSATALSAVASVAAGAAVALKAASKLHEMYAGMKTYNQGLMSNITATDVLNAGYTNLTSGIEAMRNETLGNIQANQKWRMTSQESAAVLNTLTASGMSLRSMMDGLNSDNPQDTIRKMSDMNMTYSTIFGKSTSEISEATSKMMTDLGYDVNTAKNVFSDMNMKVRGTSLSVSKFFSDVQSLNGQIDLMNANLKYQAGVLKQISTESTLGLKDSAEQAGKLMEKMDVDQVRKTLAYLGPEGMNIVKASYESLKKFIDSPDFGALDTKAQARYRMAFGEARQALENGLAESADYMSSGLASEADLMALRFATVAKSMGKSLETLTPEDFKAVLERGIKFEDRAFLEAMGGVGSSVEDVQKIMMAMSGAIEGQPTARDALNKLREDSRMHTETLSEDERLAQEQRKNTVDALVVLGNIQDVLYSKIYSLMLRIYDNLPGKDSRDEILNKLDESLVTQRQRLGRLNEQAKLSPGDSELQKQVAATEANIEAIEKKRLEIEESSSEAVDAMVNKRGGSVRSFLSYETGVDNRGGNLTSGRVGGREGSLSSSQDVIDGFMKLNGMTSSSQVVGSLDAESWRAYIQDPSRKNMMFKEMLAQYLRDNDMISSTMLDASPLSGGSSSVSNRNTVININGGDIQAVRHEVTKALGAHDKSLES